MSKLFAIYGEPKSGKTKALLGGLPCSYFIYTFDGLETAKWLGLDVSTRSKSVPVKTGRSPMDDTIALLKKAGAKYPSVVIDDLTFIADREMGWLSANGVTGWDKYMVLADKGMQLMEAVDAAPCEIVGITLHENPPKEKDITKPERGTRLGVQGKLKRVGKGGPSLPGDKFREKFAGFPSFLGRMVYNEEVQGGWPWEMQVQSDEYFVAGQRVLETNSPTLPPNIGEILRMSGYDIPWPQELAWMEQAKSDLVVQLTETPDGAEEVLNLFKVAYEDKDPKHVRWVISDTYDRVNLSNLRYGIVDEYINTMVE